MMVYPTKTKLGIAMRENLTRNAGWARDCKVGGIVRYVDYQGVRELA